MRLAFDRRLVWKNGNVKSAVIFTILKKVTRTEILLQAPLSIRSLTIGFARSAGRQKICSKRPKKNRLFIASLTSDPLANNSWLNLVEPSFSERPAGVFSAHFVKAKHREATGGGSLPAGSGRGWTALRRAVRFRGRSEFRGVLKTPCIHPYIACPR